MFGGIIEQEGGLHDRELCAQRRLPATGGDDWRPLIDRGSAEASIGACTVELCSVGADGGLCAKRGEEACAGDDHG